MAEEKISYAELLQIVQLIKSTPQFAEVHLKYGEIEIHLSRGAAQSESEATAIIASSASTERTLPVAAPEPKSAAAATTAQSGSRQSSEPMQAWPANSILLRSPMMGTFYRAPAPGAPPFVEVGQAVESGTTVCIIEVMKLMSSIAAGARGTITHILVENAEIVEFDQIIMVIDPR